MHSFQETHAGIAMFVRPSFSKTFGNVYMLGVKRPGLEFGHSPPHNNEWSYSLLPPYAFLVWIGRTQPSVFLDDTVIYSRFSRFNFLQPILSKWLKDMHVSWA